MALLEAIGAGLGSPLLVVVLERARKTPGTASENCQKVNRPQDAVKRRMDRWLLFMSAQSGWCSSPHRLPPWYLATAPRPSPRKQLPLLFHRQGTSRAN